MRYGGEGSYPVTTNSRNSISSYTPPTSAYPLTYLRPPSSFDHFHLHKDTPKKSHIPDINISIYGESNSSGVTHSNYAQKTEPTSYFPPMEFVKNSGGVNVVNSSLVNNPLHISSGGYSQYGQPSQNSSTQQSNPHYSMEQKQQNITSSTSKDCLFLLHRAELFLLYFLRFKQNCKYIFINFFGNFFSNFSRIIITSSTLTDKSLITNWNFAHTSFV